MTKKISNQKDLKILQKIITELEIPPGTFTGFPCSLAADMNRIFS